MDEALCLSLGGHDNDDANLDNITFTIKDKILVVLVVTLSAKDNKKYQNFLAKDLKDQFVGMNIKQEVRIKIYNNYTYFLELNFVGLTWLFVLIYSNKNDNVKKNKAEKYYLANRMTENHNGIINGKNLYDQTIYSHIKQ